VIVVVGRRADGRLSLVDTASIVLILPAGGAFTLPATQPYAGLRGDVLAAREKRNCRFRPQSGAADGEFRVQRESGSGFQPAPPPTCRDSPRRRPESYVQRQIGICVDRSSQPPFGLIVGGRGFWRCRRSASIRRKIVTRRKAERLVRLRLNLLGVAGKVQAVLPQSVSGRQVGSSINARSNYARARGARFVPLKAPPIQTCAHALFGAAVGRTTLSSRTWTY
jgi:hypothetical protein